VTTDQKVVPGCKILVEWPRSYADIFFGQDNCLYDSSGRSIYGQCCTAKITALVANPYFQSSTITNTSSNLSATTVTAGTNLVRK